mmetsp:Transcript_13069/g.33802  ORF Transcript_13069/g.33802 Transcript_13069/m.33802 type:complete len:207 (-) Transcript_13069:762-1382(-)
MTGKRRTTTSKRTSTMTKIFTRTTSTTTTTKAILTMTTGGTARRTTEQRQTKTDRNHKSENSEKRKNVRSKSTSISDFFVSALSPTSCFSGSSCTRGSTTFPWACCAAGCPRTRCGTIPKGTRRCHTQPSHQSSHCWNCARGNEHSLCQYSLPKKFPANILALVFDIFRALSGLLRREVRERVRRDERKEEGSECCSSEVGGTHLQ